MQTFGDDPHLILRLLRCGVCGQIYFFEMREEIDVDWSSDREEPSLPYRCLERRA
jgi:hypothetical protein